jgi:hypothetical protein
VKRKDIASTAAANETIDVPFWVAPSMKKSGKCQTNQKSATTRLAVAGLVD